MALDTRLLESGGVRLLESGGRRLLESATENPTPVAAWACPDGGRAFTCPDGGRTWGAPNVAGSLDCGTLAKRAGDRRYFTFDLGDLGELAAEEEIDTATVAVSPSGPTVGTPAVGAYTVGVWIDGGTAGSTYTVTLTAQLSGGGSIVRSGTLEVS